MLKLWCNTSRVIVIYLPLNTQQLRGYMWPQYPCGPMLTRKTQFYWYGDSHYQPETVVTPSYVYIGYSYTRKTGTIYGITKCFTLTYFRWS